MQNEKKQQQQQQHPEWMVEEEEEMDKYNGRTVHFPYLKHYHGLQKYSYLMFSHMYLVLISYDGT